MNLQDFPYNQYSTSAALYDYDNRPKVADDINFYLEYCLPQKGDVLELCCGTGRLTIPLAESGCRITGLDISRPMLTVFENKLTCIRDEVKRKIDLVEADMSNFNLGKRYSCIIIPFSSFQGLSSDADIDNCLKCVYEHLEDAGIFIVHCFKPRNMLDDNWVNLEEQDDIVLYNSDQSLRFKRTSIKREIDIKSQIIYSDLFYYTYRDGQCTEKRTEHLKLKYYYQEQLRALLEDKGFVIQDEFGYYDKRSISSPEASEMIIISKK